MEEERSELRPRQSVGEVEEEDGGVVRGEALDGAARRDPRDVDHHLDHRVRLHGAVDRRRPLLRRRRDAGHPAAQVVLLRVVLLRLLASVVRPRRRREERAVREQQQHAEPPPVRPPPRQRVEEARARRALVAREEALEKVLVRLVLGRRDAALERMQRRLRHRPPWNEIERASRPIWTSERADIETRLSHGERRLSNDVEKLWAEPVFTLSGSLSTLSSSGTTCPSSQPSGGLVGLDEDELPSSAI